MKEIKKAIIPAIDDGKKFLPITKTINKLMLPIIDKPIIHYLVEEAKMANINDIVIMIGKYQSDIINYFNTESIYVKSLDKDYQEINHLISLKQNLKISYIYQEQDNDILTTLKLAKSYIGKDNFALILPDEISKNDNSGINILKCSKEKFITNTTETRYLFDNNIYELIDEEPSFKQLLEKINIKKIDINNSFYKIKTKDQYVDTIISIYKKGDS